MRGQDQTFNGTLAVTGAESQGATRYLITRKHSVLQQLLTQRNMLHLFSFGHQ